MDDTISRQAAIEIVDRYNKSHMILQGKPMLGAASIVIELEALPSAQPEPEEDCDTCKHGYFGDSQCNNCRMRFPSHYEREKEHHGSD